MSRAHTGVVVGVIVSALLVLAPLETGATALPAQGETTVTTAVTNSSTLSPDPVDAQTDDAAEDGSTTVVGDPVADRRIRRIIIALCAVAGLVLVVTVLFWRATRPVPRALRGLQALGSRSGRRRAAASSAEGGETVSPPVAPALVPATGTASLPDDG